MTTIETAAAPCGDVLTLGTFNYAQGGYRPMRGFNLDPLLQHVADCTRTPPDVFGLSEATNWWSDGETVMRYVANTLSDMLPRGEWYEPFVFDKHGVRNPTALLINRAKMVIRKVFHPARPDVGEQYEGSVKVDLGGTVTNVVPIHWSGLQGRLGMTAGTGRLLQHIAAESSIAFGDTNSAGSGPADRPVDLEESYRRRGLSRKLQQKGIQLADGSWVTDTSQMDYLQKEADFRDPAEEAGDDTPTTNSEAALRIDRILVSKPFPGVYVPGSYKVFVPAEGEEPASDHRYVVAAYRFPSSLLRA